MRQLILLCALIGGILVGWLEWHGRSSASSESQRQSALIVEKQPVRFTTRTFDPAAPPAEMPPLAPGEEAVCESEFLSNAAVGSETRRANNAHATLTVDHVRMTLQLNITIWLPRNASNHVKEHEEGHRQISEYYYASADQIARNIASVYIGRRVDLAGPDTNAQAGRALKAMAGQINAEYSKELNPEATQLLYDSITNHARNNVLYTDAVAHAIKNVGVE